MKRSLLILMLIISALLVNANSSIDSLRKGIDSYVSQAKFDSAKIYIQQNLERVSEKSDRNFLNYELVKTLFLQSDYNEALKQSFNALDEVDENQGSTKLHFMIGCIYSAISDYQKSIEYFDLVINQSKDSSLLVQTHLLSSELYLELQDTTQALQSLTQAYQITSHSSLDQKIKDHVSIQYNYFNQNYELCKQQNIKIINDSTSYLSSKSYAYLMIGDCLINQDSLLEATTYLHEFLTLTFKSKDPEQIKIAAKKLIDVYEKIGDQQEANRFHKIYNEALNDSLSFSIEKYRELYDVEKNRELNQVKNSFLKTHFILGISLLAIFIASFYYYYRRKKDRSQHNSNKTPGKKIVISKQEIGKIKSAIDKLVAEQLFLKPQITRKSFCLNNKIKSERYLSHYINDEYKKSFSVFLNDLRIEYAYNRIKNDNRFRNYTVEQIAKDSGFGSKKSFERVFSSKYKVTPYKLILSITN